MKAMKLFPALLVAGMLFANGVANAEVKAPAVPTQVTTVATGGEWSLANASGTLRVVVVDEGFEHVHSNVWFEWLTDNGHGPRRLAARVLVKELSNGFAVIRLADPRQAFDGSRVHLQTTNPYSMEDKAVTIEAGRPGQYKIVP
jgi:hypothetical protein